MDTKRLAGLVVGTLVLWGTGYAIFNVLFGAFYAANQGTATGVDRAEVIQWAALLSQAAYAALIVYAISGRATSPTISSGARVGAIVGCLIWLTVDFTFYSNSNIANLTRTVVDPILEFVHGGLSGAVIGLVMSKVPSGR